MAAHHFCKIFSVTDQKVRSLVKKYLNPRREVMARTPASRTTLNETAVRRDHDELTFVVDFAARRSLYATSVKTSIQIPFLYWFSSKGVPSQIKQVFCDMSPASTKAEEEYLP